MLFSLFQIDPVLGSSGFGGNKSLLAGQNPLTAFGQSSDFVGQAPSNNRMPSAIGSNNTGGSNISSPAGAGILPPHSGVSDVVGMASVLGSTGTGPVGPIGGSANPGSQFMGGSGGFSSSITQSLTSQLGASGNNNSFGLGGGQTSTAGRFGSSSQAGFSSDSLSQGDVLSKMQKKNKIYTDMLFRVKNFCVEFESKTLSINEVPFHSLFQIV